MRKLTALFAAVLLAASFAGATSAHVVGEPGCASATYVTFFGNTNGTPVNHYFKLCRWGAIGDFRTVTSSDSAVCPNWLGLNEGHFNDCIGYVSARFGGGSTEHLCLYRAFNYSKSEGYLDVVGSWSGSLGTPFNDAFSSGRYRSNSQAC